MTPEKEQEVLRLIAAGTSIRKTADKVGVSRSAVGNLVAKHKREAAPDTAEATEPDTGTGKPAARLTPALIGMMNAANAVLRTKEHGTPLSNAQSEDRKTTARKLHEQLSEWAHRTMVEIVPVIVRMYEGGYYRELGYDDWEHYVRVGLAGTLGTMRDRQFFPRVVELLTAEGLSQRGIADVAGVHQTTVSREQRRQLDAGDASASPELDAGVPNGTPDEEQPSGGAHAPRASRTRGKDGKSYSRKRGPRRKTQPQTTAEHIGAHIKPAWLKDTLRRDLGVMVEYAPAKFAELIADNAGWISLVGALRDWASAVEQAVHEQRQGGGQS
jgi:transposase